MPTKPLLERDHGEITLHGLNSTFTNIDLSDYRPRFLKVVKVYEWVSILQNNYDFDYRISRNADDGWIRNRMADYRHDPYVKEWLEGLLSTEAEDCFIKCIYNQERIEYIMLATTKQQGSRKIMIGSCKKKTRPCGTGIIATIGLVAAAIITAVSTGGVAPLVIGGVTIAGKLVADVALVQQDLVKTALLLYLQEQNFINVLGNEHEIVLLD